MDAHGTAPYGLAVEVLLFVRDSYIAEVEVVKYGAAGLALGLRHAVGRAVRSG